MNWYSVERQVESIAKLDAPDELDFLHVLPGQGRPGSFADADDRRRQLRALYA